MKFFEKHANKHHLIHAPHKWFLAFLVSPIHYAEMRYKKHYHLNFAHAKKLFIFDSLLLLSTLILIFATVFWFTFDPTVTDYIELKISANGERIESGDKIDFKINFENNSDIAIENVDLLLELPANFVAEESSKEPSQDGGFTKYDLPNILPGQKGNIELTGRYYHTPNNETEFLARLFYKQADRQSIEQKLEKIILVSRDSKLKIDSNLPDKLLGTGQKNVTLILENQGDLELNNIIIPLNLTAGVELKQQTEENTKEIKLEKLSPGEIVELDLNLETNLPKSKDQLEITVNPSIEVLGENIAQKSLTKNIELVHPEASITASWKKENQNISPGEQILLNINVENRSNVNLQNIEILLPVPTSLVDAFGLQRNNPGKLQNNTFVLNKNYYKSLESLTAGSSTNIELNIPIRKKITAGTNVQLSLSPQLIAEIEGIPEAKYKNNFTSSNLSIGTNLSIDSELRYYTDDSDQLGRGPLPPQVGKETKYWVISNLQNSTSHISNLKLEAKLSPKAKWTGKNSVSHGNAAVYNANTRTVTWSVEQLFAHEAAGVYFEIGFTPEASDIGQTPKLIESIKISAYDDFIKENLQKSTASLDTSLPKDSIAQNKGVIVR